MAPRRQLAGGDARSRAARSRDQGLSRGRERLYRGGHGRHRTAPGDALRRDEGPHQGGRCQRPRSRWAPSPITRASSPAASIRCSAASRATAARSRSCSTATRSPSRMPISASPASTHSPDHRLVAYAVDTKGSEFYTVNVIDAATGALVDSRIADSNGSLEWAADSRTLLYVWLDDEHRPRRVLRHTVGADSAGHPDPRAGRSGLFSRPRRDPGSPLPPAQRPRPRDRRDQPDRCRRSCRHPAPRRAARARARLFGRAS